MDRAEAARTLRAKGFVPKFESTFSEKPKDEVLKQDPAGGEQVDEGSAVTLTLSAGDQPIAMPDVTGQSFGQARKTLKQAGIDVSNLQQQDEFSEDVEPGHVIDQDPAAGADVVKGTAITLTVSKGAETSPVPNVVGLSFDQAKSKLEADGFVVGTKELVDSTEAEGTVVAQDPNAGEDADDGATVTLQVASGKNEVPSLGGMTKDEAEQAIRDAGFEPVEGDPVLDPGMTPSDEPTVANQSPGAGSHFKLGTEVTYNLTEKPGGP
jgi:serine/threonine-protein kinase